MARKQPQLRVFVDARGIQVACVLARLRATMAETPRVRRTAAAGAAMAAGAVAAARA